MRTLLLVRHAKARKADRQLSTAIDLARPLSGRGRKDARQMGKRLAKLDLRPDLIWTSPAQRTRRDGPHPGEKARLSTQGHQGRPAPLRHDRAEVASAGARAESKARQCPAVWSQSRALSIGAAARLESREAADQWRGAVELCCRQLVRGGSSHARTSGRRATAKRGPSGSRKRPKTAAKRLAP